MNDFWRFLLLVASSRLPKNFLFWLKLKTTIIYWKYSKKITGLWKKFYWIWKYFSASLAKSCQKMPKVAGFNCIVAIRLQTPLFWGPLPPNFFCQKRTGGREGFLSVSSWVERQWFKQDIMSACTFFSVVFVGQLLQPYFVCRLFSEPHNFYIL